MSHRTKVELRAALLGFVIVGVAAYAGWIAPARSRNEELAQKVSAITRDLERAHAIDQRVKYLETETSYARGALQQRLANYPEESAQVWLPKVVQDHFKQFGIETGVIREGAVLEEKGLPGYHRAYWAVGVPVQGGAARLSGLLYSVAELEQQHKIIKVIDFEIRPNVEDDRLLEAEINIEALIRD